jgi:Zn-dependent peptidase ImmA (M78 family)/transcriptional regulator with XRE-family HTH domain
VDEMKKERDTMAETAHDVNRFIGGQIATARKAAKITQDELSEKMGFKDRQILSNIENGIRKVKPEELSVIMEMLEKPIEYFTDPYQLPDNQLFSWRAKTEMAMRECEPKAKGLVAAFRRFASLTGEGLVPIIPRLALTPDSSYENVMDIAEQLVGFLKLENLPGHARAEAVCQKLNIEIFYLDMPDEVSGASVRLDDFCSLFINRNHTLARRNFSLAHELFHVLTWDVFRPEHFSPEDNGRVKKRSEQLADNFASALLIPASDISDRWEQSDKIDLKNWIETTAEDLQVSPPALFWRLVNLGKLKRDDFPQDLHAPHTDDKPKPPVYSEKFANMMYKVFKQGDVSVRKTAKTLGCMIEYLEDVFSSHQMEAPFEL